MQKKLIATLKSKQSIFDSMYDFFTFTFTCETFASFRDIYFTTIKYAVRITVMRVEIGKIADLSSNPCLVCVANMLLGTT